MPFQFVNENPVEFPETGSMSEEMEEKSTALPGYGRPITASRDSKCFPNALFEEEYEYVH